jgi:hypothetical protein
MRLYTVNTFGPLRGTVAWQRLARNGAGEVGGAGEGAHLKEARGCGRGGAQVEVSFF